MSDFTISRRAFLQAAGAAGAMACGINKAASYELSDAMEEIQKRLGMPIVHRGDVMIAGDMAPTINGKIHCNLVFCMDGSGSMTETVDNFHLQVEGTASAFESDEVCSVIEHYGGIGISGLMFGSITKQVVPWAFVKNRGDAARYAQMIRASESQYDGGGTHISSGLSLSSALLSASPFVSTSATVDVSGDGMSAGGEPYLKEQTKKLAREQFARVNGIAMCDKVPTLDAYFKENLVTSVETYNTTGVPAGRTWTVSHMRDFRDIMVQKFMNDIAMIEPSRIMPYTVRGLG